MLQDAMLGSFVQGNEFVVGRVRYPSAVWYLTCDMLLGVEHLLDLPPIPSLAYICQA